MWVSYLLLGAVIATVGVYVAYQVGGFIFDLIQYVQSKEENND